MQDKGLTERSRQSCDDRALLHMQVHTSSRKNTPRVTQCHWKRRFLAAPCPALSSFPGLWVEGPLIIGVLVNKDVYLIKLTSIEAN